MFQLTLEKNSGISTYMWKILSYQLINQQSNAESFYSLYIAHNVDLHSVNRMFTRSSRIDTELESNSNNLSVTCQLTEK